MTFSHIFTLELVFSFLVSFSNLAIPASGWISIHQCFFFSSFSSPFTSSLSHCPSFSLSLSFFLSVCQNLHDFPRCYSRHLCTCSQFWLRKSAIAFLPWTRSARRSLNVTLPLNGQWSIGAYTCARSWNTFRNWFEESQFDAIIIPSPLKPEKCCFHSVLQPSLTYKT